METHFRVLCYELEVEIKGQELKCAKWASWKIKCRLLVMKELSLDMLFSKKEKTYTERWKDINIDTDI